MTESEFETPDPSDIHGHKRELLKRGVEKGRLYWSEIREVFPRDLVSETEMEVFVFTCENLGIELIED